ncbi:MAG: DUF4139 domain-containing protein [Planctomycetes bacterium]|nr:DUF4139 domain-containing protein [Planctomycetota bacterium]
MKPSHQRRFVIAILLAVAAEPWASARAQESPGQLQIKTRRIVAFKDGYCLVVKDAAGTSDERGEVFTSEVPDAAVLGSFWATPTEGRLTAMIAGWRETTEEVVKEAPCTQVIELLLANVGAEAAIELHDKSVHRGRIHEVLTQPTAAPLSQPWAERWRLTSLLASGSSRGLSQPEVVEAPSMGGVTGELFVLRADDGDKLLPISQVRSFTVDRMKTTLERTVTSRQRSKRLTFRFAEPAQRRELSLMYFRPGVRWIPTYRVQLESGGEKEKKTATIALQAEVLNEAEDFGDAPLDVVVGVPNFRFRTLPSPLTLEQALRNALQQSEPALMGQMRNDFSNALYGQRSSEFRREAAGASAVAEGGSLELPDELTAQGAQDLFVYQLPSLRLKTGERAAAPIFTAEVPYRDVYTWDLRLQRQDNGAAPTGSGAGSPLTLSKNEVWHQVALTNTTRLPWTTGAAMLLDQGIPVGQELLTYTSPNDEVRVPVTVSVETRGSYEEEEIDRELGALTWNGYSYAKIVKRAQLDLCNNKPVPIEAEITFRFGGKATEVSDDGAVRLDAFRAEDWTNYNGHPTVNNSTTVRWSVKLGPGETFTPTVVYHFYVRH